jgi:glycosyltransferase involved in cell wall biosynthesis
LNLQETNINSKRILFLFTELSGYFLNCLCYAKKSGYEVHVVHYEVNNEAPFNLDLYNQLFLYRRNEFSKFNVLSAFVEGLNPSLIFVSGWIDQNYLKIIKKHSLVRKNVLLIDNPWKGTLKQKIWSFYFIFFYKKYFDFIWLPGLPQKRYAKKLGFKKDEIFEGLYTCDERVFNFKTKLNNRNKSLKKLLFIGRYIDQKGVIELWDTFIKVNNEVDDKWELWCIGTGKLWDQRIINENIKHFGFVQPEKIPEIVSKCHFYVLPSKYEPWGVSLHEMISVGKPVLVSKNVGSSYCFVKHEVNGFVFSHNKPNDFEYKLRKVMKLSNKDVEKMGEESVHLSRIFSTDKWVKTLNNIYE